MTNESREFLESIKDQKDILNRLYELTVGDMKYRMEWRNWSAEEIREGLVGEKSLFEIITDMTIDDVVDHMKSELDEGLLVWQNPKDCVEITITADSVAKADDIVGDMLDRGFIISYARLERECHDNQYKYSVEYRRD